MIEKMAYEQRNRQHQDTSTVKVIVPPNLGPDRRILVQAPDGRKISAVVPKECPENSTILIQIPTQTTKQKSQKRSQQPSPSPTQRVQTIRVPESKRRKGDKFRVRLTDGRTIVATVPYDGCREFSLDTSTQSRQQRQQNWHDNPLAVAPMVFGPLM